MDISASLFSIIIDFPLSADFRISVLYFLLKNNIDQLVIILLEMHSIIFSFKAEIMLGGITNVRVCIFTAIAYIYY